jgi:hypothetical protein
MKMKKILTEWRRFIIKEANEKSNFEKKIEEVWAQKEQKYNEELSYVKAAMHATRYMSGLGTGNEEEYLSRVEFGKTAKDRIQELNRNASLMHDYIKVLETRTPGEDLRFKDTKEDRFKGIGIVPRWAWENMKQADYTGVFSKGKAPEEAYKELFAKFERLDQMLDERNYNFLQEFGKMTGKTNMDARHSGGAASTGLLIVPSEATDEEQEDMMQSYLFYAKHANDAAYIMAIKAEEELQKSIKIALALWEKYGGFKDGADIQANKGAWLRMNRALEKSVNTVAKIKNNPDLYVPKKRKGYTDIQADLTTAPQPETLPVAQDEYAIAMSTADKKEAERIMTALKARGDKRWRDIRIRTRSM